MHRYTEGVLKRGAGGFREVGSRPISAVEEGCQDHVISQPSNDQVQQEVCRDQCQEGALSLDTHPRHCFKETSANVTSFGYP